MKFVSNRTKYRIISVIFGDFIAVNGNQQEKEAGSDMSTLGLLNTPAVTIMCK